MEKAKVFLAEEVLVEKKLITYRYLSRALQLNVNVAKKALFDFHKSQNAKKPGSLHATYLLYGTITPGEPSQQQNQADREADVDMDDTYPDYLLSEQVPTSTLTLVEENSLEGVLSKYNTLEAIHVYSISSQPINDLQVLADSTRQLQDLRGPNAAEESPKIFGMIPNSHALRRQRKGQAPGGAAPSSKPTKPAALAPEDVPGPNSIWNKTPGSSAKGDTKNAKPAAAAAATSSPKLAPEDIPGPNSIWNRIPKAKANAGTEKAAADSDTSAVEGTQDKKASAPPSLKRAGSSGGSIMQAFAKGAATAKPKKKEAPSKQAAEEDTAMALSDDGGDDDAEVLPKAQQVTSGKSRKEREEELRKMMEEDDDDDAEDENDEDEREDTPMDDVDEPTSEPATAGPVKTEEASEVVSASTGDGRRRGKRRVMKKKMIEDENGYLVTIQEPGWESFSEDEAPSKSSQAAPVAAKTKKAAPKTGQGNIMSFFAKK